MSKIQKKKLLSNDVIQEFLEKDYKFPLHENDKFIETVSSLSYYLKSFSNIKRFLDYISLILKHTFNHQLSFIVPLNEKGEIWKENIKFAGATKNLKMDDEIKRYFNNFDFSKNFKLKDDMSFEKVLNNQFKEYVIKSYKVLSRGKCRGFVYTFKKDTFNDSLKYEEFDKEDSG